MSDDKKLLSENTIRRFMTLANVGPLTDNFIQENFNDEDLNEEKDEEEIDEIRVGGNAKRDEEGEEKKKLPPSLPKDSDPKSIKEEEEEVDEAMHATRDDEEVDEGYGSYARDDEEDPSDDEAMDMEMDLDAPEGDDGDADMSLSEEEAQLLISLGQKLAAAMESEQADEPEMDMGDAPADEPEMDMGGDDEDPLAMQEDIVQEVLKRVTKRIVAEKLKNRK